MDRLTRRVVTALSVVVCALTFGCDNRQVDNRGSPKSSGVANTPVFLEVAEQVGLNFEHFNGASGDYYFPETTGPGVALFDYDNDGDLDVYLLQGTMLDPSKPLSDALFPAPSEHWPGNRMYRNELVPSGQLHFIDVTEQTGLLHTGYGMGATVGDFDNDGDSDLYLTNFGNNVFYRNNGDGSFTDITKSSGTDDHRWSTSASFVDYDRDGDLDLFFANYVTFNIGHNKICRSASAQRDYCGPESYEPVIDRLFRNDGDGQFTDVTITAGLGAAFGSGLGVISADFDQDGWIDLYVANDQRANQLWMNNADGTFRESGLTSGTAYDFSGNAEASMGVTAGDFDGDGDEDLFMTHLTTQTNTLYLNDGKASFIDVTNQFNLGGTSMPFTGFGVKWFDYDNDGTLDLFAANGAVMIDAMRHGKSLFPYEQTNQLFRNSGNGKFTDISSSAGPAMALLEVSRGAAFGDIDNDGDTDIVVTNNNGPVRLMLNVVGNQNHWLRIRLVGTTSNRDGMGARVALLREGRPPIWRRAHTDGSYLSANDIRVLFGLGGDPAIEAVAVVWPSGISESWRDIEADTELVLEEGSGMAWSPGGTR